MPFSVNFHFRITTTLNPENDEAWQETAIVKCLPERDSYISVQPIGVKRKIKFKVFDINHDFDIGNKTHKIDIYLTYQGDA